MHMPLQLSLCLKKTGELHRSNLIKALVISLGIHGFLLLQTPRLTDDAESHSPSTAPPILHIHLESRSDTPETTSVDAENKATLPKPALEHIVTSPIQTMRIPKSVRPEEPPPPTKITSASSEPWSWQNSPQTASLDKQSPPEDIVDTEGLRQYRWDLAMAAQHFRAEADSIHTQAAPHPGIAEIRINIDGTTPTVLLQSSSGQNSLDLMAMRILDHSVRITPIPPSLHNKAFSVTLRMEFGEESK